jgi:hypothetical protein
MQGTLYIGARVGYSVNVEQNAVRVSVSLEDNQALLKRMTIDMPVSLRLLAFIGRSERFLVSVLDGVLQASDGCRCAVASRVLW